MLPRCNKVQRKLSSHEATTLVHDIMSNEEMIQNLFIEPSLLDWKCLVSISSCAKPMRRIVKIALTYWEAHLLNECADVALIRSISRGAADVVAIRLPTAPGLKEGLRKTKDTMRRIAEVMQAQVSEMKTRGVETSTDVRMQRNRFLSDIIRDTTDLLLVSLSHFVYYSLRNQYLLIMECPVLISLFDAISRCDVARTMQLAREVFLPVFRQATTIVRSSPRTRCMNI